MNAEPATEPLQQSEEPGADRQTIQNAYSRCGPSDYAGQSR